MKFEHNQRLDTWATLEELGPGDRVTIAGKPATVFDVVEGDEIYIVYVLDGKKTKKELSMFDALLPSETSEEEEEEWDDAFGEPPASFEEKPEVEVRYIAPGKDLFDEPGLRKSPGRRARPMTSMVPPVAEGKKIRVTKNQLRKIIREELLRERGSRENQVRSAYDSGLSDAREGYDPGSYHDWIDGDHELMISYDDGYEEGLNNPAPKSKMSSAEFKRIYGDMDVGVRGKAGY